jgi:hypothetical protein
MEDRSVLRSWKEISAYLKKDIRTCQRWEKEFGLPVHRLEGTPKARVYAFADELDRWFEKKLHEHGPKEKGPARRRRALRVAFTFGLALAAWASIVMWRSCSKTNAFLRFPGSASIALVAVESRACQALTLPFAGLGRG